jgi:hypothetical protein
LAGLEEGVSVMQYLLTQEEYDQMELRDESLLAAYRDLAVALFGVLKDAAEFDPVRSPRGRLMTPEAIRYFHANFEPQIERLEERYRVKSQETPLEEELADWVLSRWVAEVENRPLQNIYRRTLDDTWRQVYRKLTNGNEIPGAAHDTLVEFWKDDLDGR